MQDVEINKMENLEDEKMIVVWFDAIYEDETMPLVFIVPTNEDYVITPWDWQGYMPENLDEIEEIDWRINTSGRRAIMFCGLPRIF